MNKGPLVPPWHASPSQGSGLPAAGPHTDVTVCYSPTPAASGGASRTQTAPLRSSLRALLAGPIDSSAATCALPVLGAEEQNPFQKVRLRGVKGDHCSLRRGTKPVTRSFVGQAAFLPRAQGVIGSETPSRRQAFCPGRAVLACPFRAGTAPSLGVSAQDLACAFRLRSAAGAMSYTCVFLCVI